MRGFLLDTCVISEPTRSRASAKVLNWLDSQAGERLFISVVTIMEIEQGIAHIGNRARATKLGTWLHEAVIPRFESRIFDVDRATASRWGKMQGFALREGQPLALVDSLLAATAIEHDLAIVTRNVKDFFALGAEIINPWQ